VTSPCKVRGNSVRDSFFLIDFQTLSVPDIRSINGFLQIHSKIERVAKELHVSLRLDNVTQNAKAHEELSVPEDHTGNDRMYRRLVGSRYIFYEAIRRILGILTSEQCDSIMVAKWYRRSVMAGLLIKNSPREVHEWLKREAEKNRRSMTQQAIVVLEERMRRFRSVKFPPPVQTRTVLTAEFIDRAKREGRV